MGFPKKILLKNKGGAEMSDWIRGNIEIGNRILRFVLSYRDVESYLPTKLYQKIFSISEAQNLFNLLKDEGFFPPSSYLVRFTVCERSMDVEFWLSDESFKVNELGAEVPVERIKSKISQPNK